MRAWCAAKWLGMNTGSPGFDGCPMHNNVPALTPKTASAVIASGRFCASMRLRHLHIHVRRSEAIQCFACANRHGLPHRGAPLHEPLDHGCVLRRGVCIGSKSKLSPACGRRGPFQGGKGPKTPCAGSHVGAAPAAPIPCASRRMRAGTNSGIPAFGRCATPLALLATPSLRRYAARSVKQGCLAPTFGCDARRALRRVVALGPRIRALQLRFSVSSHRHVAMCRGSPG